MKGLTIQESFLSGSSVCRWYINDEEIPDIKEFYSRLPMEIEPVEKIELNNNNSTQDSIQQKTVLQLKDIDPFEQLDTRFECTVTITKLSPNQGWFYPACKSCHSRSRYINSAYKYTKQGCSCTEIEDRYKLCLMGSDSTYELEFVLFDQKAQQLIGKPIERLQNEYSNFDIPSDISNLVGQKYTCIVKISPRKSINNEDPSFEVIYIKEQYGKQPNIPTFQRSNVFPGTSSSAGIQRDLAPLVPIGSKKIQEKNLTKEEAQDIIEGHDISANDPMDIEDTEEKDQTFGLKREASSVVQDEEDLEGKQNKKSAKKQKH